MHITRAPRFHINRAVTVTRYWDDTPIRHVAGRCHVLSQYGLGADITDQLYVGEVVRLELAPVRGVYATVRNARGNRYGFQFTCLDDSQHRAITGLCEACAIEQAEKDPSIPEMQPWRYKL